MIEITCTGAEMVRLDDLEDFQGNLKSLTQKKVDKLLAAMKKDGFSYPFFYWQDKDGTKYVFDGHQRQRVLEYAKSNGVQVPDEFPACRVAAEDRHDAARKLLAFNERYGTIEDEGLYEFMHEYDLSMEEISGMELDDINMDAFEVGYFGEPETDEVPDVGEEPVSKRGVMYQVGKHRVMCGDSTEKADMDTLMAGREIDMVFTDPPYGVDYSAKNEFLNKADKGNCIQVNIENDTMTEDETNEFWLKHFTLIKEYLAQVHSYYFFSPQIQGMMMMMMMMMMKAGIPYRHVLIWVKNNHVLGRSDYMYKHEPILFGWMDGHTHKFYGGGEQKFSVWEYDKPHVSKLHPTMKPVELIINAIMNSSAKGNIIFDGFLGSGSTLIACEKTNRTCYGMEIDPHYTDVIRKRWAEYVHGEGCDWQELTPEIGDGD